jgi:hypothetical protein
LYANQVPRGGGVPTSTTAKGNRYADVNAPSEELANADVNAKGNR